MNDLTATPYDKLPYISQPFPQTHPDRLAVMAKLFGMTPPPLSSCRVLELGCAAGGNLIPMAMQFPGASFVGLDLSSRQIADGQETIAALRLNNIELRQMDISHVDESMGKFDYIIAHGVYSWVPPEVQDKLLAICRESLTPNGVAYVSYNTNPGWRMRGMIRDIMVYHTSQIADPEQQLPQARALLDFLAQNVSTENNPYGAILKSEVEQIRTQRDYYLTHEYLEEINEPLYFFQFAQRAAGHDLQYLGESEFHTMLASNFPPQVVETLRKIAPDIVRIEQYMDFLRNRIFRQTLLVHKETVLNRNLDWRSMQGFYFATPIKPVSTVPDFTPAVWESFKSPNGGVLKTPNAVVKAAMTILGERWPYAIHFDDLRAAARRRIDGDKYETDETVIARDAQVLGTELLTCAAAALVEMRMQGAAFTLNVGERPKATALARFQAESSRTVTNLRHEPVTVDEFNRQLLRHLDGHRDRGELLVAMEQLVHQKALAIQRDGVAVEEADAVRKILSGALEENLTKLATVALLEE